VGVLVLAMMLGLALAGCGDDEEGEGGLLQEAIDQGYLEVGIANEPPYGYEDENGVATGEAPEVAREVLSRLGIPEIRSTVVDFGALIPGLTAGRFDMIAAGMFITPDRAEQILFSDPDYCATQGFAVAAGNPLDIHTFDDIAENPDAVVGVISGAVEEGYAEAAGVPDDRIQRFDTTPNIFEGLLDGRIDAVAYTSITVNWQVKLLDDPSIEATEGFVPVIEGEEKFGCGGYGFRPENQAFRDAFNETLNEMKQNDEIAPIVEPFGFTTADVNQAKDVTVEDLAGGAE
jgi:polar amino acid transport system substrate-binding protein